MKVGEWKKIMQWMQIVEWAANDSSRVNES